MNVLIYALAGIVAGVLAVRAPLSDRGDPARRAFSVFGTTLALVYGAFTLYLIPGLVVLKYVVGVAGAFLPAALFGLVETVFRPPESPRSPWAGRLTVSAVPLAVAFVVLDAGIKEFRDAPMASIPEVGISVYTLGGLGLAVARLWELRDELAHEVDRDRLRYMLMLAGAALGFSVIESLARSFVPDDQNAISLLTRPVLAQGALPPIGAIFASLFVYFLHQLITESRLLDLGEMLSRIAAVGMAAGVLVGIDALSVATLIGDYPVAGAFQAFLASTLFLIAYDPLRRQLERWMGNVFNRRGQRLQDTLSDLQGALNRVLSIEQLCRELETALIDSGRVAFASVYLWDEERRAYRLVSERGSREEPPILQVARQPFTDGFLAGRGAYLRVDIERASRRDGGRSQEMPAVLDAMRGMNADAVLPFLSGDVVLGWLALRGVEAGEGFSEEEVTRLAATLQRVAVLLENLHGFEKLKEEHRLAALGTMAAGLAHEIRNPLAGIKGAAQYLQATRDGADADMVEVIIDEVDRLSQVVTQFLDYARPFQVSPEAVAPGGLVSHVAGLLRAQGLPEELVLVEEVAPDLPVVQADRAKLTQVLLNLSQNAAQAMRHGGTLTLHVRVGELKDPKARRAPAVEFAVEDTGVGISREDLDKLFVPFFTTRHDGTGLGLAISRRIMHAHGGELDVVSTPGKGSVFTARLPLTHRAT